MNALELLVRWFFPRWLVFGLFGLPIVLMTEVGVADDANSPLRTSWSNAMGAYVAFANGSTDLATDLGDEDAILFVAIGKGSAAQAANLVRGDVMVTRPDRLEAGHPAEFTISRLGVRYSIRLDAREHERPKEIAEGSAGRAGNTLIVDPSGNGDCRTITRALSLSGRGGTILVSDGVYHELLYLPSEVTLQAHEGHAPMIETELNISGVSEVTVDSLLLKSLPNLSPVRIVNASDVTITNLEIEQVASSDKADKTQNAIVALDSKDVVVSDCRIDGRPKLIGINSTRSEGTIKDNVVSNCYLALRIAESPGTAVTHNLLLSNTQGLSVRNSQATVAENTITGTTEGDGAQLIDSQVTFQHNSIRKSVRGIGVHGGKSQIKNNSFLQNQAANSISSGRVEIAGNTYSDNRYYGVGLFRSAEAEDEAMQVKIQHNSFSHNEQVAIRLGPGTDAEIAFNLIEDSRWRIHAQDASCKISNNTIAAQSMAGVEIEGTSKVRMRDNIIAFNTRGIRMASEASLTSESNNVFGNLATKTLPLADGNYVRVGWVPLTTGNRWRADIFPAYDLAGASDIHEDPKFVKLGSDYRLASNSPLAELSGSNGKGIGALGVAKHVVIEDQPEKEDASTVKVPPAK